MNRLKQIERDVLRQAREWARAELEKELQKQADEMEMIWHEDSGKKRTQGSSRLSSLTLPPRGTNVSERFSLGENRLVAPS